MIVEIILSQLFSLVTANYCEFGLCNDNQYCCGKDKCCDKSNSMWFFWAGILLVIFILVMVAICKRKAKNHSNPYKELATSEPLNEDA